VTRACRSASIALFKARFSAGVRSLPHGADRHDAACWLQASLRRRLMRPTLGGQTPSFLMRERFLRGDGMATLKDFEPEFSDFEGLDADDRKTAVRMLEGSPSKASTSVPASAPTPPLLTPSFARCAASHLNTGGSAALASMPVA
jgi:hypothetical protein